MRSVVVVARDLNTSTDGTEMFCVFFLKETATTEIYTE